MNQEVCSGCGTRFAIGFLACPRCRTVAPLYARHMEGAQVPRITVAGGASNPDALPGEAGYVEQAAAEQNAVEIRGEHGPELTDMPPGQTVTTTDYASMTQAALRDEAKTRGLPVGGSKADLAARLDEHDQQAATAAEDSAAQAADPSGATA